MENIEPLLGNLEVVPKIINSGLDFISISCSEHGLYYKSIADIKLQDTDCPRCQFLKPSRMLDILREAQSKIVDMQEYGDGYIDFFRRNRNNPEIFDTPALYYRLHLTHKETGLEFQKIGLISIVDEKSTGDNHQDFDNLWNPYRWKAFKIEVVDKIECGLLEANTIEALFQQHNTRNKITVGNDLGFNLNKTYLPNFIWQSKSKTIKPLREAILNKQKGLCTVCGKPTKDPTLDHEHIKKVRGTGLIRSTVCSQCNTFIARSENNAARHGLKLRELPDTLRRMADHLEDQKQIIHHTEIPKRKKVGIRDWNRVKKYYFNVFPTRRQLPKKPTYVTDSWLKLKEVVDSHVEEIKRSKNEKRNRKNR